MKTNTKRIAAPILALALTAGMFTAVAQTKSSTKSKSTRTATSKFHRLPAHYGKLKLKEEQVEEIYTIRETFGKKIEALEEELDELREERDEKTKDVLTRTQVTAYNKLVAASQKSSSSKSTGSSRKSSSSKK